MTMVAVVLIGVTALLHLWFLVLEMFLWRTPFGMRTFGLTPQTAEATVTLAANQGLYNGILAAGSAEASSPPSRRPSRSASSSSWR